MAKKRGIKIIARIVEAIAVILAAGLLVLHLPAVQNKIAGKAADSLNQSLGSKLSFSGIRFVPFRTLVLDDVAVIEEGQENADTLLYAKRLSATFSLKGLLKIRKEGQGGVCLDRLRTDGLVFIYVIFDEDAHGYTGNLTRAFGIPENPERYPEKFPDFFTIGRTDLRNSRVKMLNYSSDLDFEYTGVGINWADVDLTIPYAKLRNMKYVGGRFSMDIDEISATDKCGYTLNASGQMSTGYNEGAERLGLTEVTGAHIWDEWSDLDIPYYAMRYSRILDFTDYINRIDMTLKLRRSTLAMKTVAAYSGVFGDCPVVFDIRKGLGYGPVNDLHVRDLEFTDRYSGTAGDLDFVMTNLILTDMEPEIAAEVRYLDFTSRSLTDLIGAFAPDAGIDISGFARDVKARYSGSASGWLTHLRTDGSLITNYGNLLVNASTSRIDTIPDNRNAFSFDGKLALDDADLGQFMNIDALGRTSMTITAAGDFNREVTRAKVDTFKIDHIKFLDYTYTGIRGKGTFDDGVFDANVISSDPNANILFRGRVSTKQSARGYYYARGTLNLANLDLEKTGLDKRGGGSAVRGNIVANAALDTLGNMFGNFFAQNFRYITDDATNDIGNFTLSFNDMSETGASGAANHKMVLWSPTFGTASYSSGVPVTKFPDFVREAILNKYLPSLTGEEYSGGHEGQSFTIDINLEDTRALLSPLKEDIYINSGSKMKVAMSKAGNLEASLKSENIRIGDVRIKGIELKGSESARAFRLRTVNPITVTLPSTQISEVELSSSLMRDSLTFDASAVSTRIESAKLSLGAGFYRDDSDSLAIRGRMGDSNVVFDGKQWTFRKGSVDYHTSGNLRVSDMGLYLGDQTLTVQGDMSRKEPAEMKLTLEGFDLSIIDNFLSEDALVKVGGLLSGEAYYRTPLESNAGLDVALVCPDLMLSGASIGRVTMDASMDDEYDNRISFTASHFSPSGVEDLRIRRDESHFDLNSKNLKAALWMNKLDPALVQPLVKDAISFGRGSIDGKLCVDYTAGVDKIDLSRTYLTLVDTLTVIPTGVRYALDGDIRGDKDGLEIRELTLKDPEGGSALVKGRLDEMNARLKSLQVISEKGNADIFSGKLYSNGNVSLRAEDDKVMRLAADLSTAKSGNLTVSLGGMAKQENATLTFLPPSSEVEEEEEEIKKPRQVVKEAEQVLEEEGVRLLADVSITTTPDVQLSAEIDANGDNVLTVGGNGTVKVTFDSRTEELTLGGDYNIREGKFKLSAAGIFSKDFAIQEGSSVRFAGDLMDTELDITATNTVKASVATLISDTTSVSTRRDVICGISVSDRLRNPKLQFSVDVPDLDPTTEALVRSELNTEDKVQKQFLALVATGSFLPGNQSGVNNQFGSGVILNNLTAIASGQISSLLQRAGIPVDLGVNYTQNETGNDVVDLNLSTQFFDNRVIVNGSVGNRQYSATSEDNLVGDIDVEIKMDKSGRLRAKLFSHSADDYTNYLDNSQRSGAGISYQREFDNLWDFVKGIFKKKQPELETPPGQQTLTIE
ncbi:MAG: hypothetical protein J5748_07250 [Bacteroidales bacterium]|nr:hypothetical protein [Bacteroidales bacterium]